MLIGEILIKCCGLRSEDIKKSLDIQKGVGNRLGQILLQTGLINETQLISALSEQLKLPIFDKDDNDERLRYPGDINGSAENVINCRCTLAPKVRLDADGLPVLKRNLNN